MRKSILVPTLALCLTIAVAAFWFLRDPWSGTTEPQHFAFSEFRFLETETGPEVSADKIAEEYAFFASLVFQVADQVTTGAEDGYLTYDPATQTISAFTFGQVIHAPFPEVGAFSAFDTEGIDSTPAFIKRADNGLGLIFHAPVEGLGSDLRIELTFLPTDDISAQKETQARLIREQEEALATWHEDMKAVSDLIAAGPKPGEAAYRTSLPGWQGFITVPGRYSYGNHVDFPRTEFQDLTDQSRPITVLALKQGEGAEVFARERERILETPTRELALFADDENSIIGAQYGQGFFAYFQTSAGLIDYFIFTHTPDAALLPEFMAAANSLSEDGLISPAILSDSFDAFVWMEEQGKTVFAQTDPNEWNNHFFIDNFAPLYLISLNALRVIDESLRASLQPDGFPDFNIDISCLPSLPAETPLSTAHEQFNSLVRNDFTHGSIYYAQHISSGDFNEGKDFEMAVLDQYPQWDPVWFTDSPTRATGAEGPMYYVYLSRPISNLKLVCRLASENPLTLRLAEQIAMQMELPEIPPQPDWVINQFRKYLGFVSEMIDGVYEVSNQDGTSRLIRRNGERLLAENFTWVWDYEDSNAFEARLEENGPLGLWLLDGTPLLPAEYSSFDEEPQLGEGVMSAYHSNDTTKLYYSIPERRFIDRPE
ncbi:hypothetical protein [Halocynthiibacter sp.]|uniref:hypothetical protein n=1 Tax=Halocynthiibacter sp. TaxID=1979210 RepID=UPI003C36C830